MTLRVVLKGKPGGKLRPPSRWGGMWCRPAECRTSDASLLRLYPEQSQCHVSRVSGRACVTTSAATAVCRSQVVDGIVAP